MSRKHILKDGTTYLITPKGWKRVSPRHCEAKDRKGLHNKSALRRYTIFMLD